MTQPTEASHPNGDFGFGGRARQTVLLGSQSRRTTTLLSRKHGIFEREERCRKNSGDYDGFKGGGRA